jgi:hypothetical protein
MVTGLLGLEKNNGRRNQFLILLTLWVAISSPAWSKSKEEDSERREHYLNLCHEITNYVVLNQYKVSCNTQYHHYNSEAAKRFYNPLNALRGQDVKIASFNLFYPGSYKAAFKDLALVAKIINDFDVIGVQELLPVVGNEDLHNRNLIKFIANGPDLIVNARKKLEDLMNRASTTQAQLDDARIRLAKYEADLVEARTLYRSPGYLKVLDELRKLDPSWALILSPRAEALEANHVQEFTGFYYRARKVQTRTNKHCKEFFEEYDMGGTSVGCIPNFRQEFMGRDTAIVFSRRPFMASFESGNFSFTLLTSHVIFTSPKDETKMAQILEPSFGVRHYTELGSGASQARYARFAEIKVTLEFMQKYRERYNEPATIYMGDTNLEKSNPFWPNVLSSMPGSEVLVDEKTTLTVRRYTAKGEETQGMASNYDHFIADKNALPNCLDENKEFRAKAYNYLGNSPVANQIKRKYLIRRDDKNKSGDEEMADDLTSFLTDEETDEPLPPLPSNELTPDYGRLSTARTKVKRALEEYEGILRAQRTVKSNELVWDNYRFESLLNVFEQRIFTEQLYDKTYYRHYLELISDHIPVTLTCKTKI